MNVWIGAAVAVVAGFVIGSIAGKVIRRVLSHPRQPAAIREVAASIGGFVFAVVLAAGLITAVGIVAPDQLETMPQQLIEYLPKVISAGILLLLGNLGATVLGMVVGRAVEKAAGEPRPAIGRIIKGVVLGATAILAVNQLGVDTTIVNLAVAALLFSLGATFTLVAALGTRQLAGQVAAGRYVRRIVPIGAELLEPVSGIVVKVHPATVEIRRPDGSTVHLPNESLLTGSLRLRQLD